MELKTADTLNSIFIFTASFFYLLNVFKILQDKQVKGYSFSSLVFFCCWNIWNAVFFITATSFFWSKLSAISCAVINTVYVCIAIRYKDSK